MATVKVSYRFSKQVDPSNKNSPWEGVEIGVEETVDVPTDEAVKTLAERVKIQAFAQLRQEFHFTKEGIIEPIIPVSSIPVAGAKRAPRKGTPATASGLPIVTVEGVEYADYRNSEEKDRNPRFPDFKSMEDGSPRWLVDKDGKTPTEFAKAFEEASASV